MITYSITGIEDLLKKFDSAAFGKAMDQATWAASAKLRDEAKLMPPVSAKTTGYDAEGLPVDTGFMRQMIVVENKRQLAADVVAKTAYSGFVHDGTGRMPARPFFKWLWEDFGGMTAVKKVFDDAIDSFFA